MAQHVKILLQDDLDGSDASGTVSFSLDGSEYEIDLSEANADRLRTAVRPWIDRARVVGRHNTRSAPVDPTPQRRRPPTRIDRIQLQKMREWAQQNGMQVSSRGRISAAVQQAFSDAHA